MSTSRFLHAGLVGSIFICAGGAAAQDNNCSVLKGSVARLACYDKAAKKPSVKPVGVGTVEGTITWQFNKFVGTKGDVGATVFLFKYPLGETMGKLSQVDKKGFGLGFISEHDGIVYSMKVDGFGRFTRDGIPSGQYRVFVVSGKTTAGSDDTYTNSCTVVAKEFIPDIRFFNKAYCTSITVRAGERSQIVHDFGNTYY